MLFLTVGFFWANGARAEIIFQDSMAGPAGNVTSSIPGLDVEGNGWLAALSSAPPLLDGLGHLYDPGSSNGSPYICTILHGCLCSLEAWFLKSSQDKAETPRGVGVGGVVA